MRTTTGRAVVLTFGANLPTAVTEGTPAQATVNITDDDDPTVPAVTVQFGQSTYTVAEGDTQTVAITLSADPERTVTIPIETTNHGGATTADYSVVPESVTFNAGGTSQTITFAAEDDAEDDDGESVTLSFSATLPPRVTAGTPAQVTVNMADDDVPTVTVQFTQDAYTVAEGGMQTVTVTLSEYSQRMVVIPIETTNQGGATIADYSGVPGSITFNAADIFNAGDTERTFTFSAEDDAEDDDGESVRLSFGTTLPPGVTDPELRTRRR